MLSGNKITSINDNFATTPTVAGSLELGGRSLTIDTSGNSPDGLILSGIIQNVMGGTLAPAGLVKNGSGSVILTGNSTYNGGLTLNAGAIIVSTNASALGATPSSGSLTVSSGTVATLALGGSWAPGMWLYTAGTQMGTLIKDVSGTSVTTRDALVVAGSTSYSAGAPLVLNNGALMSGTPVTLTQPVLLTGSGAVSLGGPLAANNITLSGPVYLGGGSLGYVGTQTISVSSPLATGTISGALIGGTNASLLKTGAGTLNLTGSNWLPRGVKVNGGVLLVGNSSALSGGGTITMSGGALDSGTAGLVLSNPQIWAGSFGIGLVNNTAFSISAGITLGAASAVTVNTNTLSVGTISGGLGLAKMGGGTLILSGTSNTLGTLALYGGSLRLTGGTNTLVTSTTISVYGGTLYLGAGSQTTSGTILFAGGSVQAGTLVATGTAYAGQSGDVSALLSGTQGFKKTTAGILTLSGSNTFSGGFALNDGTLLVANSLALGSGTATFNGGKLTSASTTAYRFSNLLSLGGTVTLGDNVNSGTLTFDGTSTLASNVTLNVLSASAFTGTLNWGSLNFTKTGSAGLVLSGANNGTGGTLTVSAGSLTLNTSLDAGYIAGVGNLNLLAGTLHLKGSAAINSVFSGSLGGSAAIKKTGTAALTLSGNNSSFSGSISMSAGSLFVGNDVALGTGSISLSGGQIASTDASARTLNNDYTVSGTVGLGSPSTGALTLSGTGVLAAATTWNVSDNASLTGPVSGSADFTKSGSGLLTLSGNNTFSAGMTLAQGSLLLGHDSALGTGSLTLNSDVSVATAGATPRVFTNTLNVLGNLTLGDAVNTGSLTFGSVYLKNSGTWTVANSVAMGSLNGGLVSLTKNGSGTLTINGTYTTALTTVAEGTLALGGASKLAGSMELGNGAAFDSSATGGSFTLNALTASGSAFLLGNNVISGSLQGTATTMTLTTGSLTLQNQVTLRIGNSLSDRVVVNGDLNLGANYKLNLSEDMAALGSSPTEGMYDLLSATGTLTYQDSALGVDGLNRDDFTPTMMIQGSTLRLSLVFNGIYGTWANPNGGMWDSASNWSLNAGGYAPGTNYEIVNGYAKSRGRDKAVLSAGAAAVSIALPDSTVYLKALSLSGTVGSSGGYTFTASGGSSAFSFYRDLTAGTITASGGVHLFEVPVKAESNLILQVDSATLTLAGALTESGTSATLSKTGDGSLMLMAENAYSGGTKVNGGTLFVGNATALGSGAVNVNAGGLLDARAIALNTGSLTLSSGSLSLAINNKLTANGDVLLNGTVNVYGSVTNNLGRYVLLSGNSVTGTLVAGTLPDSTNYRLDLSTSTELALQHKATIGTISTPESMKVIVGGSIGFNVTVENAAPADSDALSFSLASLSGRLSGSGSASGIAAGATGTAGSLVYSGTSVGLAQIGAFEVRSLGTSNGSLTSMVNVDVYDHAAGSFGGLSVGTITLPNVIVGYSGPVFGTDTLTLSNASGPRVNLKTSGGDTQVDGLYVNNLSGITQGASDVLTGSLAAGRGVGLIAGTMILGYGDDSVLSGASANVGTLTINFSGAVYDHASPLFTSGTLALGNVREGYNAAVSSSGSLTVFNADASLRVALRSIVDDQGLVSIGSVADVAAGSSADFGATLAVGGTVGAINKVFTVKFADDSSFLGAGTLETTGTVTVTGGIYRYAAGTLTLASDSVLSSGSTLDFGTVRVGSAFATQSVKVANVAQASEYTEHLDAVVLTGGSLAISGAANWIAAGGSSALTLTLDSSTAGRIAGAAEFDYASNGSLTSGLPTEALNSGTIFATGKVYRLAAGTLASGMVQFGAVRVTDPSAVSAVNSGTLTVVNVANNDGYSDDLVAAFSGGATLAGRPIASGSSAILSAGSQGLITLNYDAAGLLAGSYTTAATLGYISKGQSGTGLADVALGNSEALTLSVAVYRLAVGSLSVTSLNLGNIRAGGSVNGGSISVWNTANTDGYSDLLSVLGSGTGGFGINVSGGTTAIAAGSMTTVGVSYKGDVTTAGLKSDTLTYAYKSVGQAGTGLADATPVISGGTVSVSANVYRVAVGTLFIGESPLADGGTLSLGAIREGGKFAMSSVNVKNVQLGGDAFSEKLNVSIGMTSGVGVGSGTVALLAAGETSGGALSIGFGEQTFASAGRQNGSVRVAY